jgi:N-acetylmuramate 1-kinase
MEFLAEHGLETATRTFLAGDASPRHYFRLTQENQSFVLMETPASEKPEQFIEIAHLLTDHGFSAPKILGHRLEEGYILLEDLTDATFTRVLTSKILNTTPDLAPTLYALATETLLALAQMVRSKPSCLQDYTKEHFMGGVQLFADWFIPSVQGHPLSDSARTEFDALWSQAFDEIDTLPKTVMLRDFHGDNLIYLKDRPGIKACGLLDFQDARWGPQIYDFVSLIDDVRVDLSPSIERDCWTQYTTTFAQFSEGSADRAIAHKLSVSRLTRILGTFTRLAQRDGKKHYLAYQPRIWRLLAKNLCHPALADLKKWFDRYLPGINQPLHLS